jgi:hypothetical protein
MGGNFTAALILDVNSTEEQSDALTNIISGKPTPDTSRAASSPSFAGSGLKLGTDWEPSALPRAACGKALLACGCLHL